MLALPAKPADCLEQAIVPALGLLPPKMDSAQVRVALLAWAWQETALRTRRQYGNGPGRGLPQYERGGVQCVFSNPVTTALAVQVSAARSVSPDAIDVWRAMEFDDVLAFAFARLTTWADPWPLPALGDERAAWLLYLRTANPGLPRPKDWPQSYAKALEAVA